MLCQNCGKNPATTHIKTIVNGKLTEYDLCSECAREMGYNNFFKEMDFGFGNLLGGFLFDAVGGKPFYLIASGLMFLSILVFAVSFIKKGENAPAAENN